jgi:hypothetical protein
MYLLCTSARRSAVDSRTLPVLLSGLAKAFSRVNVCRWDFHDLGYCFIWWLIHGLINKESCRRRRLKLGLAKTYRTAHVFAVAIRLGARKTAVAVPGIVAARRFAHRLEIFLNKKSRNVKAGPMVKLPATRGKGTLCPYGMTLLAICRATEWSRAESTI